MPPTLADRMTHILNAINYIQAALADKTVKDFANDLSLRLAIERSFEIISEASRRIPKDIKAEQIAINWQSIADLGNFLRHVYHRIDAQILWDIANRDLPPLKVFVERVIRESTQ